MAKNEIGHQCEHEGCGKWFAKARNLKRHEKSHLQKERNFKCNYEGCKDSYFRNQHLQRHIKNVHQKVIAVTDAFKCSVEGCAVSFETKLSLQNHTKIKHFDPSLSRLSCSFCPEYFYKKWQVKEHESMHTKVLPFPCSKCKESFKTYHEFKRHSKTVHTSSTKKIHKCEEKDCDLVFEKWSSFIEHRKAAHSSSKNSTCHMCQKVFQKSRIKAHLKIHDETREVFECTEEGCPRYYFFAKNLKQHVKSAHEGKGYICEFCNRQLSTMQKLSLHKKAWHKRLLKQKLKEEILTNE